MRTRIFQAIFWASSEVQSQDEDVRRKRTLFPEAHRYLMARGNSHCAQAAIDFIIERCNLSEGVRALDLGCGPGTIAIPLSYSIGEVVVDPDPGVIAEGRRLAHVLG